MSALIEPSPCTQVCLVGSRHFNTFGSHGSDAYVDFAHYESLENCCTHLREVEGCRIVGIEIVEGALPVHTHPFTGGDASGLFMFPYLRAMHAVHVMHVF